MLALLPVALQLSGVFCECVIDRQPFCAQPPEPAEAGNLALFTGRLEEASGRPPADDRPAWRKSLPELYGLPVYNRFRLRVEEAFLGVGGPSLEVFTSTECGMTFEPDRLHLVVARRSARGWFTSPCFGTKRAEDAWLELRSLRAWKQGRTASPAIAGRVVVTNRGAKASERVGLLVHLRGDGVQRQTRTAEDGSFQFEDLPRAVLQVDVESPVYKVNHFGPGQVDLTRFACQTYHPGLHRILPAIHGKLAAPAGGIVANIRVEAVDPAGNLAGSARSDDSGEFKIIAIEPGEYRVTISNEGRFDPAVSCTPHLRLSDLQTYDLGECRLPAVEPK